MVASDLRERVHANLESALHGGHDLTEADPAWVALDMASFAEDVENEDLAEIQEHVRSWQAGRRTVN